MVPWRAKVSGEVTPDVLEWYGRFAQGRPGAIVVEATGVREVSSGPLLRIGDDRYISGLESLVERVKKESKGETRVLIQLIDFLQIKRRPEPEKYLTRFLKIRQGHRSALGLDGASEEEVRHQLMALENHELKTVLSGREWEDLTYGYRERVTDMELAHIRQLPDILPEAFASASERAKRAGFDGVELHYAHAYTMASFLSGLNTRKDGYGGGVKERARLPLEVYRAVREAVGCDFAVGCRFLTEECIEGGTQVEESAQFGVWFAEAGMDFLSLSRGGKFEDAKQPKTGEAVYPYTGKSGFECMPSATRSDERGPFGRNVSDAAKIKRALCERGLSLPVIVSGGINSFVQAESILVNGWADIVGAARQSLADPDWFRKLYLGAGESIRRCAYSNYCEILDQKHKQVTCTKWDRFNLQEPGISISADGRRRLVAPKWTTKENKP
jgi:2,4-dienoyl-CoA reductase-like NADH-dependent reductase (Old Yellow Enzyme family)